MIYLICYIAIGFILMNIDKYGNKVNKILIFYAIAILTLLATFRDQTIGADVVGYPLHAFKLAEMVTDMHGFKTYMTLNNEWGYRFLVFICTKLFHSLNGVLFGTALLINGGVIIGLYRVRKHISMNFAVLAYCFLFYQETYNMMRQWIAMAIIIFGIVYIFERKLTRYCIAVAVATLFHTTAIIGLLLYFIASVVRKRKSIGWQILVVLVTLFCVINFKFIVEYIISRGWVDDRYIYYAAGEDLTFSWQMTIIRIPPIALGTVLYSRLNRKDEFHKVWFLFLIIDLIISQMHSIMDYAQRIGSYFTIAQMFELSLAVKDGSLAQRVLVKTLVLLFLLVYWYVYYIYFNFNETYQYMSIF